MNSNNILLKLFIKSTRNLWTFNGPVGPKAAQISNYLCLIKIAHCVTYMQWLCLKKDLLCNINATFWRFAFTLKTNNSTLVEKNPQKHNIYFVQKFTRKYKQFCQTTTIISVRLFKLKESLQNQRTVLKLRYLYKCKICQEICWNYSLPQ